MLRPSKRGSKELQRADYSTAVIVGIARAAYSAGNQKHFGVVSVGDRPSCRRPGTLKSLAEVRRRHSCQASGLRRLFCAVKETQSFRGRSRPPKCQNASSSYIPRRRGATNEKFRPRWGSAPRFGSVPTSLVEGNRLSWATQGHGTSLLKLLKALFALVEAARRGRKTGAPGMVRSV